MRERNLSNPTSDVAPLAPPQIGKILTSTICSALLDTSLITICLHCEIPSIRFGIDNTSRLLEIDRLVP